jgi:hypothetical protein
LSLSKTCSCYWQPALDALPLVVPALFFVQPLYPLSILIECLKVMALTLPRDSYKTLQNVVKDVGDDRD